MLIILSGLPGSGKTTLAKTLATHLKAIHLRIDTIEQTIKDNHPEITDIKGTGYHIAYAIAKDNLTLGQTVIADSVNPIEITRTAWRNIATETNTPYIEVEITCSDKTEHQHRVESRTSDIKNLTPPTWQDVLDRDYEPWKTPNITIDTAKKTIEAATQELINKLSNH